MSRVTDQGNVARKFEQINEAWRPKVIAELNGQEVKVAKFLGDFPWHVHDEADEMFLVWRGSIIVELRHESWELGAGDFCVVPKGTEHRTRAAEEAEVMIFEPAETRNTGNVVDPVFTAPQGERT
ncbi:MAG: cupin domain-containing protein [Pirellulaceae bacterium]